ncbi:Uncharacterized protein TCAP_06311 [Tolypocladium capitatum]|uniref:Uncharacterized protein n=1 Tax=Tolypocladium capitatum TaxID=45235 RepID=A0A2K3Q8C9_9HYPO|nr:Uncharacterized protein TCAP_06311 [Tolypocladium capitatum]
MLSGARKGAWPSPSPHHSRRFQKPSHLISLSHFSLALPHQPPPARSSAACRESVSPPPSSPAIPGHPRPSILTESASLSLPSRPSPLSRPLPWSWDLALSVIFSIISSQLTPSHPESCPRPLARETRRIVRWDEHSALGQHPLYSRPGPGLFPDALSPTPNDPCAACTSSVPVGCGPEVAQIPTLSRPSASGRAAAALTLVLSTRPSSTDPISGESSLRFASCRPRHVAVLRRSCVVLLHLRPSSLDPSTISTTTDRTSCRITTVVKSLRGSITSPTPRRPACGLAFLSHRPGRPSCLSLESLPPWLPAPPTGYCSRTPSSEHKTCSRASWRLQSSTAWARPCRLLAQRTIKSAVDRRGPRILAAQLPASFDSSPAGRTLSTIGTEPRTAAQAATEQGKEELPAQSPDLQERSIHAVGTASPRHHFALPRPAPRRTAPGRRRLGFGLEIQKSRVRGVCSLSGVSLSAHVGVSTPPAQSSSRGERTGRGAGSVLWRAPPGCLPREAHAAAAGRSSTTLAAAGPRVEAVSSGATPRTIWLSKIPRGADATGAAVLTPATSWDAARGVSATVHGLGWTELGRLLLGDESGVGTGKSAMCFSQVSEENQGSRCLCLRPLQASPSSVRLFKSAARKLTNATAQRPCSRCLSNGKDDACVDVQHKKRGRPRLRDDKDARYDQLRLPQYPDISLRRPSGVYAPGDSGDQEFDDPLQRHQLYRPLEAPMSRSLPHRQFDRPSDVRAYGTTSLVPARPEPAAYLTMGMEFSKASPTFLDAIGAANVTGRRLGDVVVNTEAERIFNIQNLLVGEQKHREPNYLPPILGHGGPVIQGLGFSAGDVTRFPLDIQEQLTFIGPDGYPRPHLVRMGLGKEGSVYFVVMLLSLHHRYPHPPLSQARNPPAHSYHTPPSPQPPFAPRTLVSAPFDAVRHRLSEGSLNFRPHLGHQAPSPTNPGTTAAAAHYGLSTSRNQYSGPPPQSSHEIGQSESSVSRTVPPSFQLPPIRAESEHRPQGWQRDERWSRVDIGGLIEKPEGPGRSQ